MTTFSDYTYKRDMARRIPPPGDSLTIRLAAHLEDDSILTLAEPVLAALRTGSDMSVHVSPMRAARSAFKKATNNGDWSRYMRLMDVLLNKWGIFHFHADSDRYLVFAYICHWSKAAYVLDICKHDKNWKVERRLVKIVVVNWPDQDIVRQAGEGRSRLTEAELLNVRMRGINMPVEVDGKSYLPASRALMTDGSGYDSLTAITPIGVMAKRVDPTGSQDETVKSPHCIMFGVHPDDPRPSWVVAAEQTAQLAMRRQREISRLLAESNLSVFTSVARSMRSLPD